MSTLPWFPSAWGDSTTIPMDFFINPLGAPSRDYPFLSIRQEGTFNNDELASIITPEQMATLSPDALFSLQQAGMMTPDAAIALANDRLVFGALNPLWDIQTSDLALAYYHGITPNPAASQGDLTRWIQDPSYSPRPTADTSDFWQGQMGSLDSDILSTDPLFDYVTQLANSPVVPDIAFPNLGSIGDLNIELPSWVTAPLSPSFAGSSMFYGSAAITTTGALAALWNAPVDTGSGVPTSALGAEGQFLLSTAEGIVLASNPITAPYATYQFMRGLPSMLSTSVPNQNYQAVTYGMSWLNPDSLQVLSTNVASSAYGPMGQAYYNEVIYPAYQQYGTGAAQYLDPANNIFLRGVSAAPDWAASLQLPPWMLPPTNPYAAPTLAPGSYTAYVNPADQGNVMLQFGVPLYYTISSQLDASDMAPLLFSEPDYMPSDYQLTELPLDNLDYLSALLPLVYTPDSTFLPDSQPPSETQPSSQFQPSPFDSANPDSGNPSWGYDVGGVAVPNYTSPYGWGSPNDLISMLQGSNISAFVNSIEDPYTPPSEVAAPDAENYSGDNDSTTTSSTSSDDDQGSSNGGSVDDDGGDDGGDGGGGGGYMG